MGGVAVAKCHAHQSTWQKMAKLRPAEGSPYETGYVQSKDDPVRAKPLSVNFRRDHPQTPIKTGKRSLERPQHRQLELETHHSIRSLGSDTPRSHAAMDGWGIKFYGGRKMTGVWNDFS